MNTPSFCSIGGVVYWARSPITDDQCLKLLFDYRAERRIAEDRGDDVAATKIGELISQVTAAMDRAAEWRRCASVPVRSGFGLRGVG